MEYRVRKKQPGRKINYRHFIYVVIIIALVQLIALKACYQEKILKLPDNLFTSIISFPISELTLDITYEEKALQHFKDSNTYDAEDSENSQDEVQSEEASSESGNLNLSDIQKEIVLQALELLNEDIEYRYQLYPDTGYPTDNVWISTDLISITLYNCGYDLMELIYDDMLKHKEDYPLDKKGRKTPIKYIDFRDVAFQEKFFSRNGLTSLPLEYEPDDENRDFLWQAGDIVYFRLDEENHDKDRGGFISPNTTDEGVPLVIMISPETNTLEEIDALQQYEIVGHYRYPPPEVEY